MVNEEVDICQFCDNPKPYPIACKSTKCAEAYELCIRFIEQGEMAMRILCDACNNKVTIGDQNKCYIGHNNCWNPKTQSFERFEYPSMLTISKSGHAPNKEYLTKEDLIL